MQLSEPRSQRSPVEHDGRSSGLKLVEDKRTSVGAIQQTSGKDKTLAKDKDDGSDFPFAIELGEIYEGPLDLLLDLIRKQDINIYDIPIAKITAQYLAY